MISHITVGSNNVPAAAVFYDHVLGTLGASRSMANPEHGYCGYRLSTGGAEFWVVTPYDKKEANHGNGTTIGFSASKRAQVDAFYAEAIKHGGTDEGAPGLRPQYHEHCYACYVRDLDGNKLCCICHLPE